MVEKHFQWHPSARLFAGRTKIARRLEAAASWPLPLSPVGDALTALGNAVLSHQPIAFEGATPPEAVEGRAFLYTQTGGSTGKPKLIRRSQSSWIASFIQNQRLFGLTAQDSTAVLGGLVHSLTLYGILESLHLGLDCHVLSALRPGTQAELLRQAHVHLLYATPSQLRMLCADRAAVLPDLRTVLCGGGALDSPTRSALNRLCPNAQVHVFYGAAETSFISIGDTSTPLESVGRAYPECEIRVLDEHGAITDGIGQIWVRSPYLFDGYAAEMGVPSVDSDGFVSAGEMGKFGADGFLYLAGRADRMITVADKNVFPERAEAVIASVADFPCAVLARPDAARGSVLVAVIGCQENSHLRETILGQCRATLPAANSPRRVLFHPTFPVLPSGKPDLIALAQWLEAQG